MSRNGNSLWHRMMLLSAHVGLPVSSMRSTLFINAVSIA
jgi:hypothetical protein